MILKNKGDINYSLRPQWKLRILQTTDTKQTISRQSIDFGWGILFIRSWEIIKRTRTAEEKCCSASLAPLESMELIFVMWLLWCLFHNIQPTCWLACPMCFNQGDWFTGWWKALQPRNYSLLFGDLSVDKEARKARIRLPVEVKIRKLTLESRWQNSNFRRKAHILAWLPSDVQSVFSLLTFLLYPLFFFPCKMKGCFYPQCSSDFGCLNRRKPWGVGSWDVKWAAG